MLRQSSTDAIPIAGGTQRRESRMSTKLELNASLEIIHTALEDLFPDKTFDLEVPLGEAIPNKTDREALRRNIQHLLRVRNVRVSIRRLRTHYTVGQIAREITLWSALPGKPALPAPGPAPDPDGPVGPEEEEEQRHEQQEEQGQH